MIPRRRRSQRRGATLSLGYKGHGVVVVDPAGGATTMNYGTVSGGSAPAAGDLVVWLWLVGIELYDTSPVTDWRRNDLTGAGWVQANQPAIPGAVDYSDLYANSVLAKVVAAGDIASPPTIHPMADYATNFGMWVALSVTGSISTLAIPTMTRSGPSGSAPSSIGVDSGPVTPPAMAITFVMSTGTDNSVSLSGITLDTEVTQLNLGQYYTSTMDVRAGIKLDIGGAAYTIAKGDDGAANLLLAGYLEVA